MSVKIRLRFAALVYRCPIPNQDEQSKDMEILSMPTTAVTIIFHSAQAGALSPLRPCSSEGFMKGKPKLAAKHDFSRGATPFESVANRGLAMRG